MLFENQIRAQTDEKISLKLCTEKIKGGGRRQRDAARSARGG